MLLRLTIIIAFIFRTAIANPQSSWRIDQLTISEGLSQGYIYAIHHNGKGINKMEKRHSGNGLKNMQRRAEEIGAEMDIRNSQGTTVTVTIHV